MVNTALLPAIREAIKQNEIGSASPYCLSFACLGSSGASFGIFQGDTNVNQTARAALMAILQSQAIDINTINRIMKLLGQACPNGNPLTPDDAELANSVLVSDSDKIAVDAMDDRLLQIVLGELDSCIAAAQTRNTSLDPTSLLYIALWVNMTGAPATLNRWLRGEAVLDLASPAGPTVTPQNLEIYLQANTYFRIHPKNFVHMQQSVQCGARFLPAMAVV